MVAILLKLFIVNAMKFNEDCNDSAILSKLCIMQKVYIFNILNHKVILDNESTWQSAIIL